MHPNKRTHLRKKHELHIIICCFLKKSLIMQQKEEIYENYHENKECLNLRFHGRPKGMSSRAIYKVEATVFAQKTKTTSFWGWVDRASNKKKHQRWTPSIIKPGCPDSQLLVEEGLGKKKSHQVLHLLRIKCLQMLLF